VSFENAMSDVTFMVSLEDARNVDELVRIHQIAFPGFYLTLMGAAFLHGYYSSVLTYPKRIALVARRDSTAVGFVVGFLEPDSFYAHFRAERRRFILVIVLALLRRPALILRTLRNMRRVQTVQHSPGEVELSSIAVEPSARGVGSSLLLAFIERAQVAGSQLVSLTTDAVNNDAVNRFYLKHGFRLRRQFDDGGRLMNEYYLRIAARD
jgi:ribosomal protein S18 acetylase RimI-like enzyme